MFKKFSDKIQKLDNFWKKAIVFSAIILLGTGMLFFIARNFKERISGFSKGGILKGAVFPGPKDNSNQSYFEDWDKTKKQLEEDLKKLEEEMNKATSTEFFATSTE